MKLTEQEKIIITSIEEGIRINKFAIENKILITIDGKEVNLKKKIKQDEELIKLIKGEIK
ncbi:MAG: hypothetical protein HN952_01685 [Candidatus Cloacimonetes bacterium]|jgi:hypothetical protein|nr:hypothetical protein [Candidatus Cloacimonadota bacterium]MBT6993645.1 hypothetical protein [Candidatus Cloacimonadota bacterium]